MISLLLRRKAYFQDLSHCLEDFSESLNHITSSNFSQAEALLLSCLDATKKKNLANSPSQNTLLKYLALAQRAQSNHTGCEQSLKTIAENSRVLNLPDRTTDYLNLIRQQLLTNTEESVKTCSVYSSDIDSSFSHEFSFLYGTSLILNSRYLEGKKMLLESSENNELRGQAFNNLACGQWWHAKYLPNTEEQEIALKEFKECFKYFNKAIVEFEGLEEEFNVDKHKIENEESAVPALNLSELFIQHSVLNLAVKWIKATLENGVKSRFSTNGKAFALLGVSLKIAEDTQHSEECFKVALDLLKDKKNFEKFITLVSYESIIKDTNPALSESLLLEAKEIEPFLTPWSERCCQLFIPIWHV